MLSNNPERIPNLTQSTEIKHIVRTLYFCYDGGFTKIVKRTITYNETVWFSETHPSHPERKQGRLDCRDCEKLGGDFLISSTGRDWFKPSANKRMRDKFVPVDTAGVKEEVATKSSDTFCNYLESVLQEHTNVLRNDNCLDCLYASVKSVNAT